MPETTQWAIQDRNQFPAMVAHSGTAGTADLRRVTADSNGNLNVITLNSLIPTSSNAGSVAYPDGTTEVYTFRNGTTPVGTITITYTDSTKGSLNTWSAS